MKLRKREFDIFNLSFLDVISCGFGAVVMLVLISKTNDDVSIMGKGEVDGLLKTVITLENTISELKQIIKIQLSKSNQLSNEKRRLQTASIQLENKIQQQQDKQTSLTTDVQGLSLVQSTLKQASISTPKKANTTRDEEVGGIPVDSDYVIFIVDTSGSMKQIWNRVSSEIINVLNIHPEVKGFQILNDMGTSLVSGYDGKWMPDTPRRRTSVISLFSNWAEMSNSSPVEGIQIALLKYAKPNITTSIYVFGDDYTGASYDPIIEKITKQNSLASSGKKLAKIHGIGFVSPGTTNRFGILMRELTKQNGGTFLALPL
ncbi:MAG: hypothetical protein DRQ39_06585 [Gammaproteobacteria bacterium]|nr:MAG: hypothetical protein DRQ39_06585 [Gammaproteobacteria bacterium]RKZ95153.1 MAG: hypothetical protein DRQ46_08895 [Gammaproteobacteria bacterium]